MRDLSPWAVAAVEHVERSVTGPPLDPALRVTLNFHPDRPHDGTPILAAMATAGTYRNQFETGTGNGGLTAYPGGDRWTWERRIFGGAYDEAPAGERPKYGALNHRRSTVGGAPRFGSAHLRLRAHTLERSTFCYPDSFMQPENFGTATHLAFTDLADADWAAGVTDDLDNYIEAHVHGVVDLSSDVEAVVLDPVFRGTTVEQEATSLPCPVEWHDGFSVDLDTVRSHPDYRGEHIVDLAAAIAVHDRLDPAVIGAALASGRHDPQDLKRVWHYLARFGRPT
ncbi:DUF3626 domain-containing protein [Pedococcus bigeumensis]|uniref:DUF3626 domain-containing protein n=1 Tax=Pedococcus bigeumensis TaxID=433644 RepID=A0A502CYR8_9MICO|nr:DUF3626 domain-containing protein [Pedococcus bigeumensis]TPG17299.1 DUF3626 domain-containing protein [Pedococcus bigeumensis]